MDDPMAEEFSIPVSIPLDEDGFLRRECPTCEQEFKWFNHTEGDPDAEQVDQYFCPRCGEPSGLDTWWTPSQLEYAQAAAQPDIDQYVKDSLTDAFNGVKGEGFKVNQNWSSESATPDPLIEPNDMLIVEPPCHPTEPLKVPDTATDRVHCMVCGTPFAA
jgi:hypothetical protein